MSRCHIAFATRAAKLIYVRAASTVHTEASAALEESVGRLCLPAMQPLECWYREQSISAPLSASHRQNRKQEDEDWSGIPIFLLRRLLPVLRCRQNKRRTSGFLFLSVRPESSVKVSPGLLAPERPFSTTSRSSRSISTLQTGHVPSIKQKLLITSAQLPQTNWSFPRSHIYRGHTHIQMSLGWND